MPNWISRLFGENAAMAASFQPLERIGISPSREIYGLLDAYYLNNALYDQLRQAAYTSTLGSEELVGLRNPVHRVVEAYATHLWPGSLDDALPIATANERIIDPIKQVWQWSNWAARKQVFARWFSLYGDAFIKVVTTDDKRRVFFQLIRPHFVTAMQTDERGILEYIRMDVPQAIRQGDVVVQMTHTEVWTGESYRLWQHDRHSERDHVNLEDLGAPTVDLPLSAFNLDFIPIVHVPFQDNGNIRGAGAVTHALDKIDEVNRQATRLHSMLFRSNRSLWAVESSHLDANGRPMPPPRIGAADPNTGAPSSDTLTLGDDTMLRLPSGWSLSSLVPQIHYTEALAILNAMMDELETDLPEMGFYTIRQLKIRQLSGVAMRLFLSDAVARMMEARGNAESALVRADQMALTIGVNAGLFSGIGTFDAGDFDHAFIDRPVIELSDAEQAAGVAVVAPFLSEQEVLRQLNYSDDDIVRIMAERAAEAPPPASVTPPDQPDAAKAKE